MIYFTDAICYFINSMYTFHSVSIQSLLNKGNKKECLYHVYHVRYFNQHHISAYLNINPTHWIAGLK